MFAQILGLWAISISGTLSLSLNVATNRFMYPDQSSTLDFRTGDRVNVTWASSFTQPWLQLKCGHVDQRKYYRVILLLQYRSSLLHSSGSTPSLWNWLLQFHPSPMDILRMLLSAKTGIKTLHDEDFPNSGKEQRSNIMECYYGTRISNSPDLMFRGQV